MGSLILITCSAVDNHADLQAECAHTGLLAEDMPDIAVVAGTAAVEEQDTVGIAQQVAHTVGTVAVAGIAVAAVDIARILGIAPGWYRAAHTGLLDLE